MVKSMKVERSRLSAVDRLIRLRVLVPHDAMSGDLETIAQAEHSGEILELFEPIGHVSLGRVTVFSRTVRPLPNTDIDEWVVRLHAEDKKAQDTLAALPPGPPDPL